jgi:hypothetical protein
VKGDARQHLDRRGVDEPLAMGAAAAESDKPGHLLFCLIIILLMLLVMVFLVVVVDNVMVVTGIIVVAVIGAASTVIWPVSIVIAVTVMGPSAVIYSCDGPPPPLPEETEWIQSSAS